MDSNVKNRMIVNLENREIVFTRLFDAPRELVYKVYTDPKLLPQWWGPRRLTTSVEKMDVRPGGAWRFIQHDADGNEYAFNGVYREVVSPQRLVYTFEFEGEPGHIILETAIFEEQDGKTMVTVTDSFATMEDLEGMVKSGMEEGAVESFERFTELLQVILAEPKKAAEPGVSRE